MGRTAFLDGRASRATAALVAGRLAALGGMTGAQLAAKFEDLFERPATTRNKQYLRKRLAWEIQAGIEGGLSERALQRIDELAVHVPEKWKRALDPKAPAKPSPTRAPMPVSTPPDPRLPSPGTVLTRLHGGVEHRVTVLADGFEYQGDRYRSLSAIARKITGTAWNGFLFFVGRAKGSRTEGPR
jgi:Protein of unknown function (DUF2924)